VVFKRINGNASLGQVSLFMTGLGLVNTVVWAGPAVGLLLTGWEYIDFVYIPWVPLLGAAVLALGIQTKIF
jgi:hypothetical protein